MSREPIWSPSPNFGKRPTGKGPEVIVLHGTEGTDTGDLGWLRKPESKVSYHYLVLRDGTIHQLVRESERAWHAGASSWLGRANVNDFSIGIAFSNRGPTSRHLYKQENGRITEPFPEPYTDQQYDAGAWLCADIWTRRGIDITRMTTHAAVSPGRKRDPWEHFDLHRFMLAVINYRHPPPPEIVVPFAA